MANEYESPTYICYYVFAALAICSSLFGLYYLCTYMTWRSIVTVMLVGLHFSTALEQIASIPYVYTKNPAICEFMAFLYLYGVTANIIVYICTVLLYRFMVLPDPHNITSLVKKYGVKFVLGVPLLCLLGFIERVYSTQYEGWCITYPSNERQRIMMITFVLSITAVGILGVILDLNTRLTLYKVDSELCVQYRDMVGWYIIICTFSWLIRGGYGFPLMFPNLHWDPNPLWNYYPVPISGILYNSLLYMGSKTIRSYEAHVTLNDIDNSDVGSMSMISLRDSGNSFFIRSFRPSSIISDNSHAKTSVSGEESTNITQSADGTSTNHVSNPLADTTPTV